MEHQNRDREDVLIFINSVFYYHYIALFLHYWDLFNFRDIKKIY